MPAASSEPNVNARMRNETSSPRQLGDLAGVGGGLVGVAPDRRGQGGAARRLRGLLHRLEGVVRRHLRGEAHVAELADESLLTSGVAA